MTPPVVAAPVVPAAGVVAPTVVAVPVVSVKFSKDNCLGLLIFKNNQTIIQSKKQSYKKQNS